MESSSSTSKPQVKNGGGVNPSHSGKSNSSAGIIKDRKSPEDTIFSLRCELRTLYDSLSDKNEQLLLAERDIRDRDISIRFLKSEFKKLLEQQKKDQATIKALKQQQQQKQQSTLAPGNGAASTPSFPSSANHNHRNSHEVVEEHLRGKDATDKLQHEIKERDLVILELNQKVIKLSEDVSNMQEELNTKTDNVNSLQTEIDKFRQVVRPLTRHMIESKRNAGGFDRDTLSSGMESSRLLPIATHEPRMKRTAISAEPLSLIAGMEDDLVKCPKSDLWVGFGLSN